MDGVQFGRLSVEEQMKFRRENRCFLCKKQNVHAEGCRSRYVFKNNLDVEKEMTEPSVKETDNDPSC
jgi:hypothetical protein